MFTTFFMVISFMVDSLDLIALKRDPYVLVILVEERAIPNIDLAPNSPPPITRQVGYYLYQRGSWPNLDTTWTQSNPALPTYSL